VKQGRKVITWKAIKIRIELEFWCEVRVRVRVKVWMKTFVFIHFILCFMAFLLYVVHPFVFVFEGLLYNYVRLIN